MRAGAFSPNHVGNDTAIFNEVVSRLSKRGCEVRVMSEEEFAGADIQEDVIVNMCREIRSVERLMALEEEGRTVVNSGFGIGNCTREKMTRLLIAGGIPCPDSIRSGRTLRPKRPSCRKPHRRQGRTMTSWTNCWPSGNSSETS